jgi:hypothetical protein
LQGEGDRRQWLLALAGYVTTRSSTEGSGGSRLEFLQNTAEDLADL